MEDDTWKEFKLSEKASYGGISIKEDGLVEIGYSITSATGKEMRFSTTFENNVPDRSREDLARQGLEEFVSQVEFITAQMEEAGCDS